MTTAPSAVPTSTGAPSGSSPSAPAEPSSTPAASSSASSGLQQLLDDERTSYGAPGALAVLRVGGRRTAATSGTADTTGTPITDTTRFRIASITKPIVATLVLRAA